MPCSPLSISMRPVQIPCRFFRQVIESAYPCRTRIEDSKTLCCLFIFTYDIVVILSKAKDLCNLRRVAQVHRAAKNAALRVTSLLVQEWPDQPVLTPSHKTERTATASTPAAPSQ